MSQQILQALMQLFAIIARPDSNRADRRQVVESFLRRQLNQELVQDYLEIFDRHYHNHQQKQKDRVKRKKRTSASSVRLLVICTRINEELDRRQKIIVLINLLEFVKSDENNVITDQDYEFLSTVAGAFNISGTEYENLRDFVLFPFENIPNSPDILIIDSNTGFSGYSTRHLQRDYMEGQVRILRIADVGMHLVRFIGTEEMYLNSQLIRPDKVYVFDSGTSLRNPRIKPVYFSDVVSSFCPHLTKNSITFCANDIEYRFREGNVGLQRLSFSERSGRLVGIMGSSGSGKTTLLNVLNGTLEPTRGNVLVNGVDIHREKESIRGLIGYVSQDDLLIEDLTVFQNLYYNTRLCCSHFTEEESVLAANELLRQLGLYDIKDVQVGSPLNKKISGGQRKRLNIALELIREPSILFLDEPTSGLSSKDSENIMDLLKELSLKGKLVFVVIHQPSSDIFKMFDQLMILDTGGFLIYHGDPVDAIIYFKSHVQHANWSESECGTCGNVNPEQLFTIIETSVLDEYGRQTRSRKISPWEWAYHNLRHRPPEEKEVARKKLPDVSFRIPGRLRQYVIFAIRDIRAKLANHQYLLINFLEAPVLAFLLSYIIKYHNVNISNPGYTFSGNTNIPVFLFISVIVAIFVGLTVSAEEIIRDRKILKREAFLDLSWSGYLASKISVLFIISAIQAASFVLVGNAVTEIKGMYFEYWLILFSSWCFANILGLIISDSFRTVVTIYILIPFLVIPQLVLSGVIVRFDELNPSVTSPGRVPLYGEIITARWAYEALAVNQFRNNSFEKEFYQLNKAMSRAEYVNTFWIRNLRNRLEYIVRHQYDPGRQDQVRENFHLLVNEFKKESRVNQHVIPAFEPANLGSRALDHKFIEEAGEYLSRLNRYYILLYNRASNEKDSIISSHNQTPEGRELFMARRNSHFNESLSEMVRNSKELNRIAEYRGHLYQKYDPVYRDPEERFIRAHFYAPQKRVFGRLWDTIWVNALVIWMMTLLLILILYFRLLKKGLEKIEGWFYRSGLYGQRYEAYPSRNR
jgi:ABC transport system ATP-binding/permease protein